jgi:hypothetical protein
MPSHGVGLCGVVSRAVRDETGGAIGGPLNDQQTILSDQLVSAWANFARTGNPNGSCPKAPLRWERLQGNESRLTAQWSQDFQQVLRVPRGALAASLDGSFVGDLAYQIEREVANHSHVLGAVADAQA